MNNISFSWKIRKPDEGQLLRNFLRESKAISKKALADIKFKGGSIKVNGEEVTVRYILDADDIVEITFPNEKVSQWIQPVDVPLSIIYEDDHLMVINKQANLPTIPSRSQEEHSLAGAVIHYYKTKGVGATFHAVNRLDKNTSGLLLVAKHRYMHDLFTKMQQKNEVQRTYEAIVHGVLPEDAGRINAPIRKKDTSMIEREVSVDGQEAVTNYKVKKRFSKETLVELSLESGRTHQIRVHLSHLGHPLLGDTLYGGSDKLIRRQALHSKKIRFYHPIEEEEYEFCCPLPNDMSNTIELLKS